VARGERLREWIDERFGSQVEGARELGMKPGQLGDYIADRKGPGPKVLERMAAKGLDLNWYITGETMLPATQPESAPTTDRSKRDTERDAAREAEVMAMFGRSLDAGIEPPPGRVAEPGDTMASLTPAQLATLGHEVIDLLVRHAPGHTTGNQ
jgi:transcriptional regulator with XRE-family HTH domain